MILINTSKFTKKIFVKLKFETCFVDMNIFNGSQFYLGSQKIENSKWDGKDYVLRT